jgi:hypothetical protein
VVTNKRSTRNHVIAPSNPPPISSGPPHHQGALPCSWPLTMPYHQLLRRIHQKYQHRNSLARSLHQFFSTKFVLRLYLQQLAFAQAKLGLRFPPYLAAMHPARLPSIFPSLASQHSRASPSQSQSRSHPPSTQRLGPDHGRDAAMLGSSPHTPRSNFSPSF